MIHPPRLLPTALLGVFLACSQAFAAHPKNGSQTKVDKGVTESLAQGGATQQVILTVKAAYRAQIREALEQHGDRIKYEHPLVDALTVEVHSTDVAELAKHPWIDAVSLDADVSAGSAKGSGKGTSGTNSGGTKTASTTTAGPVTTLRQTLGLPKVATSTTLTGSSGIGVAIIDSGIAPSVDFQGRITGFYDFTRGGIPVAPFDDYGHGTHIAGLIGSSGVQSNYEFQGIAPDVRLVGLKVLDGQGKGKTSDVIKAIEYVIANKAHLNVQIINLSLGHPILAPAKDDPLVQAVEQATAAGLIVVTAAGNFGETQAGDVGYTGITSPGNAPSAITVGAAATDNTIARDDDTVAAFSSRGPTWFDAYAKPNVIAPGYKLAADTTLNSYLFKLLQSGHVKAVNGQDLLALSGTSMAAGVTSGVVALILDAHNKAGFHHQKALTANLVKAMLEFSAIPVASADYLTQGAGEINASGAMNLASAISTGDATNTYWVHSSIAGFSMIGGQPVAWGERIIFDGRVMTGDLLYVSNPVWTTNIVWDSHIVWDSSLVQVVADNIVWDSANVWGSNIVWADRVIGQMDGDNIVWGTADGDNIVWGTVTGGDNIVWGTWDGDNIVWGTSTGDNIVWGNSTDGDNIVWGTSAGDNLVPGTLMPSGKAF